MNQFRLDHIAVSAETLPEGKAYVEEALGVELATRGEHPHMATHNHLLSLGAEEYFEVIAINPNAPSPSHPRWFNIDNFSGPPRLTNWILATDDLEHALSQLPNGFGTPVDLERGDFRWTMAVPEDGILPWGGWGPALIQWHGDLHPAPLLPDQHTRLRSLSDMTTIRAALPTDAQAICEILNPIIANTTITFSPNLVSESDVREGLEIHRLLGDPYLVAEHSGQVVGFAKYGPFRQGEGYCRTVETTVHLAPTARGLGIGSMLVKTLEDHAHAANKHSLIAGISAENSEALIFHEKLGFSRAGLLPRVGYKFDRFIDLVLMQKFL
ncbi:L-methionine sulfoximine/L-methionine sulfone acetyltransferase [Nymphon striatum]|nr:L-methionine sulfoximine/L-methionine sulfone acetyltransferase [Nymphon striatum]